MSIICTENQNRTIEFKDNKLDLKFRKLILLTLSGSIITFYPLSCSFAREISYNDDAALDEIVVFARKRREKIQDIPASVNILSASQIEGSAISGLKDVASFTSNFSYDEAFGRNNLQRPVIRGMSNILGTANAGFFIDGVYVSGGMASIPLFDLARVEVLKGPGTALYGRSTLAGAINYITMRPSDVLEGQISASAASHNEFEATGRISGPLIKDKAGFSLSARHYEYGGEYENTGPGGGKVGQEKSQSIAGGLTLSPSDNFGAYLRVFYQHDDDGHTVNTVQPATDNNCYLDKGGYFCGEIKSPDSVALNLDIFDDPGIKRDIFRTSLLMDWQHNYTRISSISSYSKDRLKDQRDNDYLPIAALGGAFHVLSDTEIKTLSQELRLNYNNGGALRWLFGGYFYTEKIDDSLSAPFTARPSTTISPVGKVTNYAIFASLEYDILDNLSATMEMRSNWDKISIEPESGLRSETFKSVTPRFALSYKFSPDFNLYMTVAKGTKPGGFNGDLFNSAVPESERTRLRNYLTFAEEKVWNYEIGLKSNLMDGRVHINVAGFFIDWTDQQLTTSLPIIGHRRARPLIHNAGKTEIWGFEAEMQARPSDQWSLSASYGFVNATFKEFEDETQEKLTGDASVVGNHSPRSPKHSFNLSSRYTYPLKANMDFFLQGDLNYKSSRFVQVHNLAVIGDVTKVNIRSGVEWQDVRVSAFVENLFQNDTPADVTRYFDASSPFMPRAFLITLPKGRVFGLDINYSF
ncbi:MAG: TonB-dependent receptor [Emcibacter sp.]|nr:TonB-dependent receptor [Emcibacter sp.]